MLFAPEGNLYRILIVKSLWMSFTATIAVVLLAYPMAYYLAFGCIGASCFGSS